MTLHGSRHDAATADMRTHGQILRDIKSKQSAQFDRLLDLARQKKPVDLGLAYELSRLYQRSLTELQYAQEELDEEVTRRMRIANRLRELQK